MNDREFKNLKPGDRVFYVTNWWDGTEEYKAYELEVKGKKTEKDGQKIVLTYCESGDKNCRCGGHNLDAGGVGLTKAEAWKAEIELVEERIKNKQDEICEEKELLYHHKIELAKAKEEEESGWVIINEHIYKAFPSDLYRGFQKYATEQEAYEALAEYYTKKAEEAWIKSGAKYYGTYKMVALLNRIKPIKGSQMVHATCVWQRSCYCGKYSTKDTEGEWRVDVGSLFNTEAEAYAKMEKETPQNVRADDYADKISEQFKAEADAQALEAAERRQV